ncbi:DNA polymerase III subunit chi, partial [Salmonella enterica subsp. enterica serovar Montevideo]|nr:DNA polymerase III subunit chi [Salmonella enterica subsp. enterica serovar Montevideo]
MPDGAALIRPTGGIMATHLNPPQEAPYMK